MRKVLMLLSAILLNFAVGGVLSAAVGAPALVGGIGLNAVALISPLFGIEGLRAGIYAEVWTGEAIKAFRTSIESIGWLNKIRSYDQYVSSADENDVIHFIQIGGDPEVLINNTTYPLGVTSLEDADKAISLDKYQTKATAITDDELYAITFDKMQSVIERHRDVVNESKYRKALHSLAPRENTTATPVVLTTGAADGNRKTITRADILTMKKAFDKMKVPVAGRVLVLCPDHVNDLLQTDQKFADQYYNYTSGKISNLYGFEVYEYTDAPHYTVSTKKKAAFGAVANPSTDRTASVAFYAPRMMKATGQTLTYLSEAKSDPLYQRNLYNVRHNFVCLPLKEEAIGAIVSDIAA